MSTSIIGKREGRVPTRLVQLACVGFLVAAVITLASAVDGHVVVISETGITPPQLEVRVGDRVRWQAAGGQRLHLELDPHQDEHEIVTRQGEIQAVFLTPGEHWYQGAVATDGGARTFRGTVTVREAEGPRDEMPECSWGSSSRVCFAP